MTEEPQEKIYPNVNAGLMPPQSLELTRFMVTDDVQIKDEQNGEVIEGDIPGEMLHFFWGFLNKDARLTRKEKKDIEADWYGYKAAEAAYIMSTPRYKFTFETLRHLQNLERKIRDVDMRSLNGFEREMQTRQTQAMLYGDMGQQTQRTGGGSMWNPLSWAGRLFGGGR